MRKLKLLLLGSLFSCILYAQETFPINGTADERNITYAFTHATIIKDAGTSLKDATLVIKQGKVVGLNIPVPKEAVIVDCKGKFIYPSFIDLYSDYGVAPQASATTPTGRAFGGFGQAAQINSNVKGAFGWNQAIRTDVDAYKIFQTNESRAKELRSIGFGTVLANNPDGIARGTGTLITLGNQKENFELVKEKAAAFYSFNKGTSTQEYPGSLMGSIALIRQTYLDAQWYKTKPASEGTNLSLEAWNDNQTLPQIFDAGTDKWNVLRADKIAKEFGVQYIIRSTLEDYQRIDDIKATKASLIVPINFPQAMDVDDPNDARVVALADMKHWEMAPSQPAMLEKAGINFALTASGNATITDFLTNLRKAIQNGLTEKTALDALTKTPASLINVYDKVGSLDAGKLANFFITSNDIFKDSASIFQNWVQGQRYIVNEDGWDDRRGVYNLVINSKGNTKVYEATLKGSPDKLSATLQTQGDSSKITPTLTINGKLVRISWSGSGRGDFGRQNNLGGVIGTDAWSGNGYLSNGDVATWKMVFKNDLPIDTVKSDTSSRRGFAGGGPGGRRNQNTPATIADVIYPFIGFGNKQVPKQEDILITNTTVWTNEKDGKLENTDVLIKGGKIVKIGKGLSEDGAKKIDGTGKYLTAGIIDEHSHIAVTGEVNECTQAVTSEVRIADVLNPEDIAIYRHLASGVTSEHILHGSCNPIGGQTQLIKLRWGKNAEEMKFANWDPFIKFALGENVKSTRSQNNIRFPDTRMGVEQVYDDAFQRALDYEKLGANKRRDLELDALVEILNKKRFITCHSYVQSEINMLMHVADKFGFRVNTFTHILEGYKVADKMKEHGAYASTFSDWWAYKMEVQDAIAYNAAIMQKMGLIVAVNSDDAEQATHLNQEAAKSMKYGGVSEEEAFKMCTLNPAIMLHVADRVGSIKVGKDADVVLWSDNPLSVYAKSLYTIVDGTIYFDRQKDAEMEKNLAAERNRLIQKLLNEKRTPGGAGRMTFARPRIDVENECEQDKKHKQNILLRDDN
jgi:imidazolonepropionase-like amidohydrolase